MTTYTRPDARVVDIEAESIMEDFQDLPNSVNGATAQDPTFEDPEDPGFTNNSIWY